MHVEEDVRLADELEVEDEDGLVVIPRISVLDPVSRSVCITVDFNGASTYKFCTRSGPGLGVTRLILTGAWLMLDKVF